MDKPITRRNNEIDFVKGVLVVGMVIYHSLDYFYFGASMIKYVRFITGAFIFISGFLVSHIYMKKYNMQVNRICSRLFVRGFKLLILFILLNAVLYFFVWEGHGKRGTEMSINYETVKIIFISGTYKIAAFDILIPIGYVLILFGSLILLFRDRIWLYIFLSISLFLYCSVMYYGNQEAYNLRYISIGFFGFSLGFIDENRLLSLSKYATVIVSFFLIYLLGLNWMNQNYPQYVALTILNLMVIYLLGSKLSSRNIIVRKINLIGQYSLFSYLTQIAFLQLLSRAFSSYQYNAYMVVLSFLMTNMVILFCVVLVNHYRKESITLDKLYKYVFA